MTKLIFRKNKKRQTTRRLGSHRGIFLAETICAVSIITFVTLSASMILLRVYDERQMIRERTEAMHILQRQLLAWETGASIPQHGRATMYRLDWLQNNDHQAILTVAWTHRGKAYQLQSEAQK